MTQTTKMIPRKVAIAFAILCVATLIALNISIIAYYSEINTKDSQIKALNEQLDSIEKQVANLTLPNGEPKLISIDMQYNDNRTDPNAPFLEMTGYVVNVGQSKANNCKMQVSAIQNGNNTAIEGSTPLQILEAGAYQEINIQFPYTGQPLIAFSSNLEWNS